MNENGTKIVVYERKRYVQLAIALQLQIKWI